MNRNSMCAASAAPPPTGPSTPAPLSRPQLYREPEYESFSLLASVSTPPTLEMLSALQAVPSGMVAHMQRKKNSSRKGRQKLASEGQIVSVPFDVFGKRPYPVNGISLEQGIQLELSVNLGTLITSSTTGGLSTFAGRPFQLSDFSGAASLTSVFDQYRIDQIEVWLEYNTPNSGAPFPQLTSAVDLDDANTPSSAGQVADRQGSVMSYGPSGHYHKWKPHVAIAAFSGAFTSYANAQSMWIDSASNNVQHYGLKAALLSTGTTAVSVSCTVRAVISFRAPAIN